MPHQGRWSLHGTEVSQVGLGKGGCHTYREQRFRSAHGEQDTLSTGHLALGELQSWGSKAIQGLSSWVCGGGGVCGEVNYCPTPKMLPLLHLLVGVVGPIPPTTVVDVIVVGGGWAGMTAADSLSRACLSSCWNPPT
jgi:hypothetical protein